MPTFDHAWRLDHADAGDEALRKAHTLLDALHVEEVHSMATGLTQVAMTYAAIAQAHYAAANVRAKPGSNLDLS